MIRIATADDVSRIVTIHMNSFPGFFLTFLGPRFLRLLYANVLKMPDSICLVGIDDDQSIGGFVVGTLAPEGMYRRLIKKNWLGFAIASIVPTLRNPSCIPRLLRAFSAPTSESTKSADCLLMSIGVNPDKVGGGLGWRLISEFLDIAAKRGARSVSLTTDRQNNDGVNNFYIRNGFSLSRSFNTPEGREMNEYFYDLLADGCN